MLKNLFLSDRKLLNAILRVKLKYMVNGVVVKLLPTLKHVINVNSQNSFTGL